jgi:hypothetical protein
VDCFETFVALISRLWNPVEYHVYRDVMLFATLVTCVGVEKLFLIRCQAFCDLSREVEIRNVLLRMQYSVLQYGIVEVDGLGKDLV